MAGSGARFHHSPHGLTDRHEGLEWEPAPAPELVPWAEALTAATAAGWRLPTTGELIALLDDLRREVAWAPADGTTLWSASGSPFAPASQVRAVSCEAGGEITVILLDKTARAQRWGVR